MKARILFLNDTHNEPGGAEYQVIQLASAIRAAGGRAFVACIPGSGAETDFQAAGLDTIPLAALRTNPIRAVSAIKRICRERSIDIIHTASFLTNFCGRMAGRAVGAKVVTTVHCEPDSILLADPGFATRLVFMIRAVIDKATAPRTDVYIAVSKAVAGKLIAGGAPAGKVTVISNGVDADAIRQAAAEGRLVEPVKGGDLLSVGTMARLDPVKGVDVLIRAVALIAGRGRPVRLLIIGEGRQRPVLDKLVSELGVADKVIFAGYQDKPYAKLAPLDIYAVSSHSEGQNLTVLTAMALGLPVVATGVGGIIDMVTDGDSGLLVPPRDPEALARAIERLADDEGLKKRLIGSGEAILAKFTVGQMCRLTLAVYARESARGAEATAVNRLDE